MHKKRHTYTVCLSLVLVVLTPVISGCFNSMAQSRQKEFGHIVPYECVEISNTQDFSTHEKGIVTYEMRGVAQNKCPYIMYSPRLNILISDKDDNPLIAQMHCIASKMLVGEMKSFHIKVIDQTPFAPYRVQSIAYHDKYQTNECSGV